MLFSIYSANTCGQIVELCEQYWVDFTFASFYVSVKLGNICNIMIKSKNKEIRSWWWPPVNIAADKQTDGQCVLTVLFMLDVGLIKLLISMGLSSVNDFFGLIQ